MNQAIIDSKKAVVSEIVKMMEQHAENERISVNCCC